MSNIKRKPQPQQYKRNRQTYLAANSQFLVLNGYDASIHKADPDWPVDWDFIEEVRFKQSIAFVDKLACPICLDGPPIAARITRCGHIYCWSCILQYLSLANDHQHQPCPICFESIYKDDLRSVVFHTFVDYSVGDEIDLQLMIRFDGYVEVEPYFPFDKAYKEDSHIESEESSEVYGNLIVVNPNLVLETTIKRERKELEKKIAELSNTANHTICSNDKSESFFVDLAKKLLETRADQLATKSSPHIVSQTIKDNTKGINSPARSSKNCNISKQGNCRNSSKHFLFYQSSDGQHIYLSPFCTKIIKQEFQNLQTAPLNLRGKILQSDFISMNEVYKKRFKFLSHLPLSCEFQFIELDFSDKNVISEATFKEYETEILKRDLERRKRRKQDKRRDEKWQEMQKRKIYGVHGYGVPSSSIDINNLEQFPSVGDATNIPPASLQRNYSDDEDDYFHAISSDEEIKTDVRVKKDDTENDVEKSSKTNEQNLPEQPNRHSRRDFNMRLLTQQIESVLSVESNKDEKDESSAPVILENKKKPTAQGFSFKDIQLEQQAYEAGSSSEKNTQSSNKKNAFNNESNSATFAQLMSNVKSRNSSSWANMTTRKPQIDGAVAVNTLNSTWNKNNRSKAIASSIEENDSDIGGEELRAPTSCHHDFADLVIQAAPLTKSKRIRKSFKKGAKI